MSKGRLFETLIFSDNSLPLFTMTENDNQKLDLIMKMIEQQDRRSDQIVSMIEQHTQRYRHVLKVA